MTDPKRIDPPTCGCTDCITGYSRPLFQWGDDQQFAALLHGHAENATSVELADLPQLLNRTGRQNFGEFLCAELRAGRVVSKPRIESKALALSHILDDLFD